MTFTTRRPLVTLVGVVSAEWWSQRQAHSGRRRVWKARLEKGSESQVGEERRDTGVAGGSQVFGSSRCES